MFSKARELEKSKILSMNTINSCHFTKKQSVLILYKALGKSFFREKKRKQTNHKINKNNPTQKKE